MKVTYLHNVFDTDAKQDELASILEQIKNGKFKNEVETIRLLKKSTKGADTKDARELKQKLPLFFPALLMRERVELNGTEEVTGLVQFDIDLAKNPNMDAADIISKISKHPSTIYAYISVGEGVRFALLTDFARNDVEHIDVTRGRYPEAYRRTKAIVEQIIDAEFDDQMQSIKSSSHVSYDPNLYHNPNAEKLVLGDILAMPAQELDEPKNSVDGTYIRELLTYVPTNLPYDDMLKVAFCVIHFLGQDGYNLVLNHFDDKHGDLAKKLSTVMKKTRYGYLVTLEKYARQGGWKPKTGKGRKVETNKPSNHRYSKPMSATEALKVIEKIIQDCIRNGTSHYISVSCGIGKSETFLKMLLRLQRYLKIQVHSFSGKLQDSLYARYENLSSTTRMPFDHIQTFDRVKNIKGMRWLDDKDEPLCLEAETVDQLRKLRAGLPLRKCYNCLNLPRCGYINQFSETDHIRFASTAQYFGETSKWDNGVEFGPSGERPRKGNFIPDLIIVDEDCIQLDPISVDAKAKYFSLSQVVSACQLGMDLKSAIDKYASIIRDDYEEAEEARRKEKQRILKATGGKPQKFDSDEFQILDRFASYIFTANDDIFLDGIRFVPRKDTAGYKRDAALELNVIKKPNKIYGGIPTIYLDATAEEDVVRRVFPNVPFTKIHVKQSDDVKVYQLEGSNVTKQWLSDKKNVEKLVERIASLTSQFTFGTPKIGLITYQAVRDDEDFYQTLAKKIGAQVYGYFGNVRGRNDFADVDFLFVVGRYSSNDIHHERMSQALFKHDWAGEKSYVDQPIHMTDGSCRSLNSHLHLNHVDRMIYRHCSVSETIQAIGRARLIHGKPKTVYLFSNESLGEDVQISGFFQMSPETFDDQISAISVRKYIDLGKVQMRQDVGITDHMWREKREILIDTAKLAGIKHVEISGVDASYNPFTKQFLVADHTAFQAFANSANGTLTYLN